jgi:hypothetical protein
MIFTFAGRIQEKRFPREESGNPENIMNVRFHVLTAASMKIKVFWSVAPGSIVGVDRRFSC